MVIRTVLLSSSFRSLRRPSQRVRFVLSVRLRDNLGQVFVPGRSPSTIPYGG
jgi:hypothetical protein